MFGKKKKEKEVLDIPPAVTEEMDAVAEAHKDLCNFMGTIEVKLEELLASNPELQSEKARVHALMNAYANLLDNLDDVENRFKGWVRSNKIDNKIKDMGV